MLRINNSNNSNNNSSRKKYEKDEGISLIIKSNKLSRHAIKERKNNSLGAKKHK